MTDAYVIEIDEDAVGLVVRVCGGSSRNQGYRFYASLKGYQSLEGRIFSNPESARRSAKVISRRRPKSSPASIDPGPGIIGHHNLAHYAEINPIDLRANC